MWGGARAGAGRKAKHSIASEPHKRRAHVAHDAAVHVSARVVTGLGRLRGFEVYRALERGLVVTLRRFDFRIVQLGIRGRRVELIVEAGDRVALAKGMQGFQIAAAKLLNRLLRRKGTVFADRYHPRALTTRPAIRDAVSSLARAPVPISGSAHAAARTARSGGTRAEGAPTPPLHPIDAAIAELGARFGPPPGARSTARRRRANATWRPARSQPYVRHVHAIPQGYILAAELAKWAVRKLRR